ncbi:MAG: transcriptional regulator [Nannocystaceae bacterium]|nr:transcriptional regulator [Nannocystaceae bacterium]
MTEIAQLFESALRENRASLLRKAAKSTIARMPPSTTLSSLLESDAGEAVRALTLSELTEALAEAGLTPRPVGGRRRRVVDDDSSGSDSADWGGEAAEAQLFRRIVDAMSDEPLTIGQLCKEVGIAADELRGYLAWMKKAGKVTSSGRARATRYQAVQE